MSGVNAAAPTRMHRVRWNGLAAAPRSRFFWLVLVITGVGGVLRFATLGMQSFDGDELLVAWHVHQPIGRLFSSVANAETTPFPYYLLAKAWAGFFGSGEVGLRSLSALAGTATVPVAALTARELLSDRAGLVAALLVAVNPLLVWYSQQARPYALFALFGALAMLYFARALLEPRARSLILWGLSSAFALCMHYFAIFCIAPQAAWLIVRGVRRYGRRLTVTTY